jgi:AAA domain, putative AbiEii toxin, Type IV TA system
LRMRKRLTSDTNFAYLIEEHSAELIRKNFRVSSKSPVGKSVTGETMYMQVLAENVPTVFILNAERRLDSDFVPDPSDEVELRQVMHYSEPKRIHDLVVKSREIALSQALSTAARWISNKAIHGANQGSMNVHSVYGNVLKHLVSTSAVPASPNDVLDIQSLLKRLVQIESKTLELTRHELATSLSMNEFRRALGTRSKPKQNLAANLVKPYIESLEGRLEAVDPIYQLINQFLRIINGMLSDKELYYTLSSGFSIKNKLGESLQPAQLSSGEQQLLLLFCYVLTARDNPSVFMIDEPEISLNVKWQRLLVQSLLEITRDSSIQFIFASHSMELLAQHKSRVVKLVNLDA